MTPAFRRIRVTMGFFFPIVFVLLVLVLIGVLAYLSYLQEKKRREALAALAGQLGWQFVPDRDSSHDEQFANFEIFRRGHGRYAYNTLYGELEIDGRRYSAKMGDFRYKVTSGSGKSRSTRTYNFSYLIVGVPYRGVPDLLIRREGLFDMMAGALGFDDIDFESAEFSRNFYVKSADKRFAYDVIHPRMMEFLLQTEPPMIDIEHGRCCLSDGSQRWTAEQFQHMLRWTSDFFDAWPDHVKADLESR